MTRHQGRVRSQFLEIVRSPAVADDLVQETFLRVWTRAAQFRRGDDARAWLARIGVNLALNQLRSQRRAAVSASADTSAEDASGNDDPLNLADADEVAAHLQRALAKLPEGKRAVQELSVEGMELRAIADELGIPVGTAKSTPVEDISPLH
jgi:RNA polymerase sigma-70 factor (ECF subfamily)